MKLIFEAGDRVRVDGMVHLIEWSTHRGFDTFCVVVDNYHPAYLIGNHAETPEEIRDYEEKARQMQVANDEPTTCLVCLHAELRSWRTPASEFELCDGDAS